MNTAYAQDSAVCRNSNVVRLIALGRGASNCNDASKCIRCGGSIENDDGVIARVGVIWATPHEEICACRAAKTNEQQKFLLKVVKSEIVWI